MAKVDTTQCDVGIVGLDDVSRNLALNFKDHQFKVAVWDPDGALLASDTFPSAASLSDLTRMLRAPRTILLSNAQKTSTDATINELLPLLDHGDVLVDASRSHFKETLRRSQQLAPKSVSFMALGITGGGAGPRGGSSFTAGGSYESRMQTRHLWEAIAAEHNGLPCVSYVGCAAGAHFVNMVHDGIECRLAQLLSETFDLLKATLVLTDEELEDLSGAWHIGVLKGRLMEISGCLIDPPHGQTSRLQLAERLTKARTDETERWIEQSARELDVDMPSIDVTEARENSLAWQRLFFVPAGALFVGVGQFAGWFLAEGLARAVAGRSAAWGFAVNPHGRLMPQMPARLHEIVKMSDRYICNGSSAFSPILKAAVGEVGVMMASTFSNASKNPAESKCGLSAPANNRRRGSRC
jgi:6-phosphogluconate dehydrogenase (decarboxylating)